MEGQVEHHHEKKSVLTKVKDRAKKMKDTFTKHGQGHDEPVDDHDHQHDEEDNVDEEVVDAPPIESTVVGMDVPGQESGQLGVNLEKPTSMEEDRHAGNITEPPTKPLEAYGGQLPEDRTHGQPSIKIGRETELEDNITEPPTKPLGAYGGQVPEDRTHGQPSLKVGRETELEDNITEPPTKPLGAYGGQVPEDRTHGQPSVKVGRETELEGNITEPPTKPLGAYGGQVPEDRIHGQPSEVGRETELEDNIIEPPTKPLGAYGGQVSEDRTHGQPSVKIGRETELEDNITAYGGQVTEDRTHGQPSVKIGRETELEDNITEPPTKPFGAYGGQVPEDRTHGQPSVKVGKETELEDNITEPPTKPFGTYGGQVPEDRTHNIGRESELEEDPHTPKDRCGGVSDPSNPIGLGGEEEGIAPILSSFDRMNVHDKPESKPESGPEQSRYTGSHDQFSGSHDQLSPENPQPIPKSFDSGKPENPHPVPKSSDSGIPEDMPRDTVTGKPSNQSYTEMITSATSAMAGTAISAKNVVASKLGYGGEEGTQEKHEEGPGNASKPLPVGVAAPVTEKLAPVYEKVAGAGSTVMSKSSDSGKHEDMPRYTVTGKSSTQSYTEMITSATSAMAGTAISAKNVVASKLGYGGEDGTQEKHEEGPGTGPEQEKQESGTTKGPDKGVSVKEYLAEKFRPSEEDRALSDVISGSIHKREEESEKEGESKPVGKVTESEEVTRRLGTEREDSRSGEGAEEAVVSGEITPGKGVVGKLKGAVGSWFGKTEESQSSPTSLGARQEGNQGNGGRGQEEAVGEQRLQESSN